MRLTELAFYKAVSSGQDELGNEIEELKLMSLYKGRFTPWTREDIELIDRTVTKSNRKLLTLATKEQCQEADYIKLDNVVYKINNLLDYGRWRCFYVEVYKHGN